MAEYKATIGLEIHAELATKTKMFCRCANNPDETTPNNNICPVCLAHPGTLPVINKEAVKEYLKLLNENKKKSNVLITITDILVEKFSDITRREFSLLLPLFLMVFIMGRRDLVQFCI